MIVSSKVTDEHLQKKTFMIELMSLRARNTVHFMLYCYTPDLKRLEVHYLSFQ